MPLDQNTATIRIIRGMRDSEGAIAEALVAATALIHTAALAHRDVGGASVANTHAAFKRLTDMTTGLLEVQAQAARAHGLLLKIGGEVGALEEPTCPDNGFNTGHQDTSIAA